MCASVCDVCVCACVCACVCVCVGACMHVCVKGVAMHDVAWFVHKDAIAIKRCLLIERKTLED